MYKLFLIIASIWCAPGLLLYFYLLLFEVGLKETIKDKWYANLYALIIVVVGGWASLGSFILIKRTSSPKQKGNVEETN